MTSLHLTVAIPDEGPAILTLPQPLTAETLLRLEQAIASTLGMLRRDLCGGTAVDGAIEYASWMPYLQLSRP